MNYIIDPNTNQKLLIHSLKGRIILKKYIQAYTKGGSSGKIYLNTRK